MPLSAMIRTPLHETRNDLDHYLRSLSQKLDPSREVKTKPSNRRKSPVDENLSLVKDVLKRIYVSMGPQRVMLMPFVKGGSGVHARSTHEFDVDMVFAHTNPRGAFKASSGAGTVIQLSNDLTRQEKSYVRSQWQAFMDNDTLKPHLMHVWLTAMLKRALIRMDSKTMLSDQFPNIIVIVNQKDKNGNPVSNVLRFTAKIQIEGKVPTILQRHPLPMQLPYSKYGSKLLRKIQMKLKSGQVVIRASPKAPKPTPQNAIIRLSSRQSRRSMQTGNANSKASVEWEMEYSAVESEILKLALRLPCIERAEEALRLVELIKKQRAEYWDSLTPHTLRSTMLWLIKRGAHQFKSVSDWYFGILNTLKCVLCNQYCPGYYNTTSNVFLKCEKSEAERVIKDIEKLMQDAEEKQDFYRY